MRLLDLCCGAGGAAMGYHRAGFTEIVGVDLKPQPRYPFTFVQGDALDYPLEGFDAVHASPPCQRHSVMTKRTGDQNAWPDLIAPLRARLRAWGGEYVIENVVGAPLLNPIVLCGTMFPSLRVIRHRLFETNFAIVQPPHIKQPDHPRCYTTDRRKAHGSSQLDQSRSFVQVTGGGNCTIANARAAMGIDWMQKHEINEAIPPAYTEYIGRALLHHLRERAPR